MNREQKLFLSSVIAALVTICTSMVTAAEQAHGTPGTLALCVSVVGGLVAMGKDWKTYLASHWGASLPYILLSAAISLGVTIGTSFLSIAAETHAWPTPDTYFALVIGGALAAAKDLQAYLTPAPE